MQLDLELYRKEMELEPGIYLSYIDVAPQRPSQTLVLLHGFGGNARQWQYQFDAFTQYNHVIAPDMRGHGQSSAPIKGYDLPRLVADLKAVLDQLGVYEKVVLIGHSFGVALATEFAHAYPDRVGYLILISGAGEYNIANYYKLAFRLPGDLLAAVQPIVKGWVDASLPAMKRMYLDGLHGWRGWDLFPVLKMPVMVIIGNRDRVLPQAAYERVTELVPAGNSEIIRVDVSAHMVMVERRDAVNRAIKRFVEQNAPEERFSRWNQSGSGVHSSLMRERPWLAYYESTVPPTIHVPQQPLTRLLERARRRFPKQTAVLFEKRKLSYAKLYDAAIRFANGLIALGVTPGTRVVLLLPNVPQMVVAYYGTLFAGGIAVMVNPFAAETDLIREVNQVGAEVIVALTFLGDKARQVRNATGVKQIIFTSFKDYLPWYKWLHFALFRERREGHRMLSAPDGHREYVWTRFLRTQTNIVPPFKPDAEETAVIQFTGGTIDAPKPVKLSHRNLIANTLQVRAWLTDAEDGAEKALCVVPFSHVYGMTVGMNVPISQGATLILQSTFDTEQILRAIRDHKPTFFPGVPVMYMKINNFPNVRKFNVRSIKVCLCGAAPMPIEIEEAFEKLTKGKLVEGYGLSEAAPVTHLSPLDGRDKVGSIGLPLPNTEARIVDLNTGRPLPAGQIGELVIRGPQVMQGYWEDDETTARVLDESGWLRTYDIGRMDTDGFFQIISRRQDMGHAADSDEPIFPRDIEEVIYELPEVDEVVVIITANIPVAFVRLKVADSMQRKAITTYCQHRLPPAQVPRLVYFVKDFERNLIGKAVKRDLVDEFSQQIEAESGSVGAHLFGLTAEEFPSD